MLCYVNTNHGSIECVNGKWYIFYHRQTHGTEYSRQACAEPIEILPDGTIPQVEITSCGLNGGPLLAQGEYPAAIACNITNGKMPTIQFDKKAEGVPCVTHGESQRYITGIENGTLIGYKYFTFSGKVRLTLTVRGSADGKFVISDGDKELGEVIIGQSKSWKEVSAVIETGGVKSLLLTCQGDGMAEFLSFCFSDAVQRLC